jgi:hypothetical protein
MQRARRAFIRALAALAAAPIVTGRAAAWLGTGESADGVAAFARLRGLFAAPESAAAIGAAYLRAAPEEARAENLAALLFPGGDLTILRTLPDATLRRRLGASHRDDFAAGRTAAVDGWILSRSEARLYAAISLAPTPAALV